MHPNLMSSSQHLPIYLREVRLAIPQPSPDGKERNQHFLLGQDIHHLLCKPRLPIVNPKRE